MDAPLWWSLVIDLIEDEAKQQQMPSTRTPWVPRMVRHVVSWDSSSS